MELMKKLQRTIETVTMQGVILTALEDRIQVSDQRRPTAEVAYFAAAQILHFEAEIVRGDRARFAPNAQGKQV